MTGHENRRDLISQTHFRFDHEKFLQVSLSGFGGSRAHAIGPVGSLGGNRLTTRLGSDRSVSPGGSQDLPRWLYGWNSRATCRVEFHMSIFDLNPYESHPALSTTEADLLWEYAKLAQHIKDVRQIKQSLLLVPSIPVDSLDKTTQ